MGYKLLYFDLRARGEAIRMIFEHAGVKYENDILDTEHFLKMKPTLPTGQIPVLDVDGHRITQSGAIIRFLSKRFNLSGKDEFQEALADELFGVYYDRFQEQLPYMLHRLGNPNFKNGDELYKEKFVPSATKALEFYASIIKQGQKTVSSDVTYIDFVIAEHLETMFEWWPESTQKYPQLVAFKDGIYALPTLTKYIQNRKKTTC